MNTAPITFRKHGYNYRQLKRTGNVALYEQGGGVAFEVVRIRTRPSRVWNGRTIPAGEYLPATSEWGRFGWTFHTKAEAEDRMATLTLADKHNANFATPCTNAGHPSNEPAAA